jgi:hypothetical protein
VLLQIRRFQTEVRSFFILLLLSFISCEVETKDFEYTPMIWLRDHQRISWHHFPYQPIAIAWQRFLGTASKVAAVQKDTSQGESNASNVNAMQLLFSSKVTPFC